MDAALTGRRIVVPETRELDLMVQMLERQGALAIRCPLVAIHDAPDPRPILDWLRRFIASPPSDVVLMTGEGLGRLLDVAERHDAGLRAGFIAALSRVRRIARGPKPVRRLRSLGLEANLQVEPATTAGLIAALSGESLGGRRIAVVLYPDDGRGELLAFLESSGAEADPVLPYVYASAAEDREVVAVIDEMAAGRIDLVAFTSSPQVRRLRQVARDYQREGALRQALQRTAIAAVGPVVARAIEEAGGRVSVSPSENFHLKPMVNAIVAAMGARR